MDFTDAKNKVLELIKNKRTLMLATSIDDRVTARSVSCVLIDDRIYFQTDKTFLKYHQIIKNHNVALCIDNIQIEGAANIKGHPLSDENKEFTNKFIEEHEGSFKNYSHMKNEAVVEVELKLITLWKYIDGKPLREFIDFQNQKSFTQYYDNSR
jgi:uncharacterized pyridoxamine 5'-phosphate oxidase family protein